MVAKTNKYAEFDILDVRTREKILRLLYDGKERSAYKIALQLGMATATIIDHLNKLEEASLINTKDATKGKLIRRHYMITPKGKEILLAYLKEYINDIKRNKEIEGILSYLLKQ